MRVLSSKELADELQRFFSEAKNPALFAGAGVGIRTGLPSWKDWLTSLADEVGSYDELESRSIQHRINGGYFMSAASSYLSCPTIPEGEKLRLLAQPFQSTPHANRLERLVSLPFRAIFTTNYDNALHDAYAMTYSRHANVVEIDDGTMSNAPYDTGFLIARLHGRARLPKTMIVSDQHYEGLSDNAVYLDFCRHILTQYNCLFIGFSFLDPAIGQVLTSIRGRISPDRMAQHMAVLPGSAPEALVSRLADLNINTVWYGEKASHADLWAAIRSASLSISEADSDEVPRSFALESIARYVSVSYANIKLRRQLQPLRDEIYDGIMVDLLLRADATGMTIETLAESLNAEIGIGSKCAAVLVRERVPQLEARGWCKIDGATMQAGKIPLHEFHSDINLLVEGTLARAKILTDMSVTASLRGCVPEIIDAVLASRGWDLGAYYAESLNADLPRIADTITAAVKATSLSPSHRDGLVVALVDLFQNPDDLEAAVLSRLGRIAFALDLVLRRPCAAIAQAMVFPEIIYFDASFLMPAIVRGHPYRELYSATVNRLVTASAQSDHVVELVVSRGFLNEIIAHRNRALRDIQPLEPNGAERIQSYVEYCGPENVNVFIGAYASWVRDRKEQLSFRAFLNDVAPYETEQDLEQYLAKTGVRTSRLQFRDAEAMLYHRVFEELENRYTSEDGAQKDGRARKESVLIEHEARQLTRLDLDAAEGRRSWFITADSRLHRLADGKVLERAGASILSCRSIVLLVDMILGFDGDPSGTSRLLWGGLPPAMPNRDRDFLLRQALKHTDEAMTLALPQVLDAYLEEDRRTAGLQTLPLLPGGRDDDPEYRVRYLDRLEIGFYKHMSEAVERRFPSMFNYAKKQWHKKLEESIAARRQQIKAIKEAQNELQTAQEIKDGQAQLDLLLREIESLRSELRQGLG